MTTQQRADELLAGWHAARAGMPYEPHASAAWREGYKIAQQS